MPILDTRQYRSMEMAKATENKLLETEYYVEGYATKYAPYLFYEDDDGPIYERFERDAFNGCDMTDVIFQLNHQGRVYARQSNGSLILRNDDIGLFTAADLGRTESARGIYDDISAGMLTKMSWGFDIGEAHYDKPTRTIVHTKVKKIYDVSAVAIPANDSTSINARSWGDGVISQRLRSDREREDKILKSKIALKLKIML